MSVSKTGYGVDVSLVRTDELEKRLVAVIQPGARVLDIGCGAGGAAARLSASGADVVGLDIYNFREAWSSVSGTFVQGDVREVLALLQEKRFDYCICNRVLHYVTYDDAVRALQDIRLLVTNKIFVSLSGLTSALTEGYESAQTAVTERHGLLSDDSQATFGITVPMTLYLEDEALQLLTQAGWRVVWSRTTDFGNVLVEAV